MNRKGSEFLDVGGVFSRRPQDVAGVLVGLHGVDAREDHRLHVLIGGAILLGDNWRVLDPLAAVIVSLF
uniref:hypothetical protein n=1 Tax=Bilophila wadsworthia TaxID=35833 RepID=UPI003AB62D77